MDLSEIERGGLRLQPDDQSFSCETARTVLSDLQILILWHPDQALGAYQANSSTGNGGNIHQG